MAANVFCYGTQYGITGLGSPHRSLSQSWKINVKKNYANSNFANCEKGAEIVTNCAGGGG